MHPENLIHETREYVRELAKVQNERFNALVEVLDLDDKGEEWLWDYIFNYDETTESFEEYLQRG